ncbi:MAG: DUF4147 domain-containing protein [Bacteroidota bacterium]
MTGRLEDDARAVFEAAVRAVQAPALLDGADLEALAGRPVEAFDRVAVVGVGKASMALAGALERRLGAVEGEAVVPEGYVTTFPAGLPRPARVRITEAGHPVPTAASAETARRALARAEAAGPDDLVLALISGGGSALWALPPDGVPLADVQATTRLLLAGGVDIAGINAVRKHLSQIAGGQLAQAAAPARLVALVLSDVVGDDLSTIASGPTVGDPTTFADALAVLDGAGLADRVPASVGRHLHLGAEGAIPDTPASIPEAATVLIGTNRTAVEAAAAEAARRGYRVEVAAEPLEGEARDVGRAVAAWTQGASPGTAYVAGGETTVTVTGAGRGGRNQEVAVAAALALDGTEANALVLSGGTDGIDGPTDAAGGWATSETASGMRTGGVDPEAALADNDACTALDAAGTLLHTGPTHTNVADVIVALRG